MTERAVLVQQFLRPVIVLFEKQAQGLVVICLDSFRNIVRPIVGYGIDSFVVYPFAPRVGQLGVVIIQRIIVTSLIYVNGSSYACQKACRYCAVEIRHGGMGFTVQFEGFRLVFFYSVTFQVGVCKFAGKAHPVKERKL